MIWSICHWDVQFAVFSFSVFVYRIMGERLCVAVHMYVWTFTPPVLFCYLVALAYRGTTDEASGGGLRYVDYLVPVPAWALL